MKINKWTLGLAAAGVVSLSSVVQAEEAAHQVLTAVSSTTISGYVSTSAIWSLGSQAKNAAAPRAAALPFRAYDGAAKQDSFNLDVINLTISKALDESEWSAGYKAELLFGPDAATFASSPSAAPGDTSIKQAYVQLRAPVGNGLDFKVGVWDTPIGYEVFNAGENPNYSRSFGYVMEPTTYTGVLANYKAADFLSLWAGVADGGTGVNIGGGTGSSIAATESLKSYMAGVNLTAPDSLGFLSGSTLSFGAINHASGAGAASVLNLYVGATIKTGVEGLLAGASYDYQGAARSGAVVGSSFYANATAIYLSYQVTEKVKTALRAEYASGTSKVGSASPFVSAAIAGSGGNTELVGLTGTVDYKLWENVISRVEMRWDHNASGSQRIYGGTGAGNTAAPHKNAIQLAMNIIYKF